jgi:hypothetical protein
MSVIHTCIATGPRTAAPAAVGRSRIAVVLCAGWCRTCDAYRPVFDALRVAHPGVQWHWVDIEDDAGLVGDIDIQTFPTLLLAEGERVWFAGPVLPNADVAHRLLAHACGPDGREVTDAQDWAALVRALQAHGAARPR